MKVYPFILKFSHLNVLLYTILLGIPIAQNFNGGKTELLDRVDQPYIS